MPNKKTALKPNLFCFATPAGQGHHAIRLAVSTEDRAAFDQLPARSKKQVTVTDLLTGDQYRVRRYPCGQGCWCAAQAEKVEKDSEGPVHQDYQFLYITTNGISSSTTDLNKAKRKKSR